MNALYMAAAVLVGALLPFQAGANIRFGKQMPTFIHAAFLNFLIGGAILLIVLCTGRAGMPSWQRATETPWWGWCGGLLGALFVLGAIYLNPKLGAVMFLVCAIAGQMLSSAFVDHFGLVGFAVREITPARIGGMGLVLCGMAMIRYL